jgi:hypothetical protein
MHCQNYLDALDTVLAWDLPDEALADAVIYQFRLIDGLDSEDVWERHPDSLIHFQH